MECTTKLLIIVVGMPGSGKSIVSEVAKSLGIPVVALGDVVREEVKRRGLEPTLRNLMTIAEELRHVYGPAAIARLSIEQIKQIDKNVVLIDGVRSLEEVKYLQQALEAQTLILAIHASPRTRFERLRRRGRAGDPRSWNEFVERDLRELSWGLGNVIALADKVIVNEGRLDEFINSVTQLLSEVLTGWCSSEQKSKSDQQKM